jgi:hypothetical protein
MIFDLCLTPGNRNAMRAQINKTGKQKGSWSLSPQMKRFWRSAIDAYYPVVYLAKTVRMTVVFGRNEGSLAELGFTVARPVMEAVLTFWLRGR